MDDALSADARAVMRRTFVALVLLGCIASPPATAAVAGVAHASGRVPDEVIVRFSARADGPQRAALRDSVESDAVGRLPVPGGELLRLRGGVDVDTAVARLQRSRVVLYAEPNVLRESSATMNDPFFDQLWGLRNTGQLVNGTSGTAGSDIAAQSAWDLTTGSAALSVAVIDSGVAADHPDLRGQIAINSAEIAANRIDDDANGYVDDIAGWDFVAGDALPEDASGHGTHVAGTIAARGNDGVGVVGVAPTTRIMPLRVLDADGSGSVAHVISAFGYAARKGARVVNLSLDGDRPSRAEYDAIAAAPEVLFVVAAGNGGSDRLGDDNDTRGTYPCAYDLANVMCVAASDRNDHLASFSNHGAASVDLAAPGVSILSDQPLSSTGAPRYAFKDGTSMATPHVSGAAALALALRPDAALATIRQALLDGTDARPELLNRIVSHGRLNARHTLELLTGTAPSREPGAPSTTSPAAAATTGPAPQQSSPPAAQAPAPRDSVPPLASLLLNARQPTSIVRRLGLRPRVGCSEACTASAVISLSARAARQARLRSKSYPVTIGRGSLHLPSPTSRLLTIRLTRTAKRALGRMTRPLQARLTLTFTDTAGNRRTLRKSITLTTAT